MNESTEILNELKNISPALARIEKVNVFEVPKEYFNELAEKIVVYSLLHQNEVADPGIEELGAPILGGRKLLKVPEGYFDTLSSHTLAKIKTPETESSRQELQQLSPLLFSLRNIYVFTVPSGYFENVSNSIVNGLKRNPAKIVSIAKGAKWWKYAAAAVITAAIALSTLPVFNHAPEVPANNLATTRSATHPGYIESSFQYKTAEQVNEGISTLSDDDIINYLEKHGNILDDEILESGIDAKELPDASDYLTDDKALNKYLDKITTVNNN